MQTLYGIPMRDLYAEKPTMAKEHTENQRAADMTRRFKTLAKLARGQSEDTHFKPLYREYMKGRATAFEMAVEMVERTF